MGMPLHKLTLAEYIEWENAQDDRNEYVRGEVFAMVGGRRVHGRVVGNLVRAFANHLQASPCQVFAESMKVQVANDTILYPDVFVTCDREDLRTDQIFTAPLVIVEVLSPSTQAYNRGLKFALYRSVAALREYVLIDPDTRTVEAFRVGADGLWVLHDMTAAATLTVPAIDASIPLAEVFAGVDAV